MSDHEARVATSTPGDGRHNTLVLAGLELVIPLEAELDGDPDTRDRVRLRREDGGYEAELSIDDAGVEREGTTALYRYHFYEVPPGQYRVEVKVAAGWFTVLSGLKVTYSGATVDGRSYEDTADGTVLGTPEHELIDEMEDDGEDEIEEPCAS